jgi:GDP-4-dehydro-6-deoxy-D-mannose reductase
MKKVLITGANGFVGRHLIERLQDHYELVGLAGADKPMFTAPGLTWSSGDITDSHFTDNIMTTYRPDAIIHLAAKAPTWGSDGRQIFEVNVMGTVNLYESIVSVREQGTYNPRIIYVSSAEIYGKAATDALIDENTPLMPINPYGASKAAADRLSFAYTQNQKLDILIARPFTHTGPGQAEGFFVPDMITQIVAAESDPRQQHILVGSLQAVRDYSDVRDVVSAYELLLEAQAPAGEAFNICSGTGIKMADILARLLSMTDKKLTTQKDPKRLRPSEIPVFVGDNAKLQKATGWKPHLDLDQTLRDSIEQWRQTKVKSRSATTPSSRLTP